MLFTSHAIAGAAIGIAVKNPSLGFFVGFIAHIAMDAMPHFDQGSFYVIKSGAKYLGKEPDGIARFGYMRRDWVMLFVDMAIGGTSILILLLNLPADLWIYLITGTIGCLMPDIIDSSPLWSEKLRKHSNTVSFFHKIHMYFHWTAAKSEFILGSATQIAVIVISLFYILGSRPSML